jgi:NADH dehydrogenase FAD-containing subunit
MPPTASLWGNSPLQHAVVAAALQSILVVGGGPVGMETAGEIAAHHKDKKVTLVTSKG